MTHTRKFQGKKEADFFPRTSLCLFLQSQICCNGLEAELDLLICTQYECMRTVHTSIFILLCVGYLNGRNVNAKLADNNRPSSSYRMAMEMSLSEWRIDGRTGRELLRSYAHADNRV